VTRRDIPNLITLLRLLLLAPLVILLLHQRYDFALLIFAFAGASDALDGYLARHMGWSSPLGAFLDPLADKLLMATTYFMLGWLDLLPIWLVALVIGRDVIIIGGVLVYSHVVERPEMSPSRISKLNTLAQIVFVLSVLSVLAGIALPHWWITGWLTVMVVTILWSGVDYVWRWSHQAMEKREEGK